MSRITSVVKTIAIILAIPVVLYLMLITMSLAHASDGPNLSVCHPNNGVNGSKGGWTVIEPDKASSHIDEDEYNATPQGEYWKHEAKDGRHDVYADSQGNCPSVPDPVLCENGWTLVDYKDGAAMQDPICKGPPTGCPYGDSIPLGPDCDKHKPVVENTTPTPVTELEYAEFQGK